MSAAAGAAGAAHAAMMNAVRSFGVVVTVPPDEFLRIVERQEEPLVVTSSYGIFSTVYRYLVSYKGLAFYAESPLELDLPVGTDVVQARKMMLPG